MTLFRHGGNRTSLSRRAARDLSSRPVSAEPIAQRHIELDGFSLQLREAGADSGSPLVCIHGGPGLDSATFFPDHDRWGPGLLELGRHHPLIAYDQRGCGGSGVPDVDEPLALSRYVDDIESLRIALGLERIALFGHSFGTVLALLYPIRYPDRASHLVLVGAAPTRDFIEGFRRSVVEDLSSDDRERYAELQNRELTDDVFRERFRATLPLYFHRELSDDDRDVFVRSISFSARVNRALAEGVQEYDLRPALPHITTPTLVIYGESDRVIRPTYPLQFHGLLPRARFIAFQESGHFPYIEEPEPFARVVDYFLRHSDRTQSEE